MTLCSFWISQVLLVQIIFHYHQLSASLRSSATHLLQAILKPPVVFLYPACLKIPWPLGFLHQITFQHSLCLTTFQLPAFHSVPQCPASLKTTAALQDLVWLKIRVLFPDSPSGPVMFLPVPRCYQSPATLQLPVVVTISTLKCPGHILIHQFLGNRFTASPPQKVSRWLPHFPPTCTLVQHLHIIQVPLCLILSTIMLTIVQICSELFSFPVHDKMFSCFWTLVCL